MESQGKQKKGALNFLQTKVMLGYLLIILLAVISMFFIINNLRSFSLLDSTNQMTQEKMVSLNHVFYNLYEAECLIGEAMVTPDKFNEYELLSDTINAQLAAMKEVFTESEQQSLLDSMIVLMEQKLNTVQSLVLLASNSSIDELYRSQLMKAIEENDSLLCNRMVEKTVKVVSDTLKYHRPAAKKRSFFRRIFSSSTPDDTVVEIRKSEFSETDSLLSSYNPADTINQIFENIKSQVREKKVFLDRSMMNKMIELQKTNKSINVKMNSIISELQEEDWKFALSAFDVRQEHITKLMSYLRYFVMIAVALFFVFIMMVWRDITKSKRYNSELQAANQQTLKLMDSREKLMLSVAHDIKAPLSSIIGYIELLDNNKLNVKQSYYLDNMKSSSEHILHLVTDILDFNRLDAGGVELNPLPFDSRSLFEDVVATFRPQAEKKNLTLDFRYSTDTGQEVLVGDPLRIRQIVHNLVSNAVKFTQKGGVSLEVDLKKRDATTCMMQFVVADTGVGISEEDQKVIFNEYVRVGKGAKTIEGFGLGLSILRKLVDIHNGTLSLKSEVGKGTSFSVQLPLPYSNEVQGGKSQCVPAHSDVRILVIDDDPSQLTMISEQLKSRGFVCMVCDNPYSALDIIEKNYFDVILSDIQMPGFNGFEIVKRVRNGNFSNAKTIPVIALSARADISLSKFKKHGFTSFLNKPFTCNQLVNELAKYVAVTEVEQSSEGELPSVGFEAMLSFAGGDKDAEREILTSFLSETKKNVAELKRLQSVGDVHSMGRLAHKMLAIFKMLGDASLVEWLSALEKEQANVVGDVKRFGENTKRIEQIVAQGEALAGSSSHA